MECFISVEGNKIKIIKGKYNNKGNTYKNCLEKVYLKIQQLVSSEFTRNTRNTQKILIQTAKCKPVLN